MPRFIKPSPTISRPRRVDGRCDQFLESQGVDAQAVYRINLALEEMVTNIIKYGYDAPGGTRSRSRSMSARRR
jgi:anti-sigma regulatory factor (Ser/Thr protein kinase)